MDLQELYRDLHTHPELSFQEVRTAGIVAGHLEQLGLRVHRG
ncbi:amidohydrolase, partial [Rhizobium sp. SIMBA_035]